MKFHSRILTVLVFCFSIYSCTDYRHFAQKLITETRITDIYPTDSLHWQVFTETMQRYRRHNPGNSLLNEIECRMRRSAEEAEKIKRDENAANTVEIVTQLSEYRDFSEKIYRLYLPYRDSIDRQAGNCPLFLEQLVSDSRIIDSLVRTDKTIRNLPHRKSADPATRSELCEKIHTALNDSYNSIKEEMAYHTLRFSRYIIAKIAVQYPGLNEKEFNTLYSECINGICRKLMCPLLYKMVSKDRFSSCIMTENRYTYEEYLKAIKK